MSRLSSGLPIFALSHLSETLQKLSLCRGVVPLFFDAAAFDQDSVDGRAIEYLVDGGYLRKGDSILLTKGAVIGTAGSTNIMQILPVF
jgi:pyruvate kinase